jgi:hypothetical protein
VVGGVNAVAVAVADAVVTVGVVRAVDRSTFNVVVESIASINLRNI